MRPFVLPAALVSTALALAACSGNPEPVVTPPAPTSAPTALPSAAPTTIPAAPVASVTPTAAPTTAPVATPAPAEKKGCSAGMALVPGGKITLGAPKHEVTIGSLCIDVSETTADEYAACVKTGKCSTDFLTCAPQHTYGTEGKGNHPINCVDFAQATSYCGSLQKRLLTNEEWEYASRGSESRPYPWGADKPTDQLCWSGVTLHTGTCPVASSPKGDTPQGIHDLAGNVFEWTTKKDDARTPTRDGRGGSWKDGTPDLVRPGRPGSFETTYRCGFLGIRCATDAPPGAVADKK
ncbi:MAG: SUMF1/EgtB/PvdO family nonheme iron enzyme [Byssovorax sp.]